MEKRTIRALALVGACLWLLASAGIGLVATDLASQGPGVDCDREPPGALQRAIDRAQPGITVRVSGTCNESVTIPVGKDLITLDGGGNATVRVLDTTSRDIMVRGRGITITGFTIAGGQIGIDVSRGGTAVIDGNTIEGTARFGIIVGACSTANIVNNTIQNNVRHGIQVNGNSFAFIGFRTADDTVASPNTIRNNGIHGINVVTFRFCPHCREHDQRQRGEWNQCHSSLSGDHL